MDFFERRERLVRDYADISRGLVAFRFPEEQPATMRLPR